MTSESIIPQGFVPTSECIRWLNLEAMRLLNAQHETVMNWLNSNAKTIGIFRNLINQALNEAFDKNMDDDDMAENEHWLDIINAETKTIDSTFDGGDADNSMPF